MNAAALFSGGKDSTYALYLAMKEHDVKCLLTLISENPESYMFHVPNIEFTKMQAKALELPLLMEKTKGEKEKELMDLRNLIIIAKEKYDIKVIVAGALASRYQKERIEAICADLDLELFAPLWGVDAEEYMSDIIKNNFKVIITAISAEGLDKSFLGKVIDFDIIKKLKIINKKTGINIAGEGGEYESFVLDGPIFKKKVVIEDAEISMEKENTGVYEIKKIKLVEKS